MSTPMQSLSETPAERIDRARADLVALLRETETALESERTRRRGALMQRRHELRRMLDPNYRYSAQAGQDEVVDRLFRGARGLRFADIGGYDGVTGSNTLFLEQHRGWTGLLVEPMPDQHARAQEIRHCPCLRYAVGPRDGEAQFLAVTQGYTQMSGLADSYDPAVLEKVRANPAHAETAITVETRRLSRILEEQGLESPDFVSLDIEGGEVAVLEEFDFARHRIAVWSIENNDGGAEIGRLMQGAGYRRVEFCGPDEIWAHPGYTSA